MYWVGGHHLFTGVGASQIFVRGWIQILYTSPVSTKKGTKAVTGAVPFQKVHFCTQRLHIDTLVVHIST